MFIGALAILACELPIILAALGFAGLSAKALRPPPLIEKIAIVIAVFGALALLALLTIKLFSKRSASK